MGNEDPPIEPTTEGKVIPDNRKQRPRLASPTVAKIKEQTKSRNSFVRLCIVGGIAIGLVLALIVDVVVHYLVWYHSAPDSRPYNGYARDILLVISSVAAYLLGKGTGEKREDD